MNAARTCLLFFALSFASPALASSSSYDRLLPNSVAVDATIDVTRVDLDGRSSLSTRNRSTSASDAARLLNSVTITTLPSTRPPKGKNVGFDVKWVPSVILAHHDVTFEDPAVYLADSDFRLFRISAGFGPDLGLTTQVGRFYLDLAPSFSYSWVSWSSPVSGGAMWRSGLGLAVGGGYHNLITRNWGVRAFVRSIMEDARVWNEALDSSQGFDVPVTRVSNVITGASLLYSW